MYEKESEELGPCPRCESKAEIQYNPGSYGYYSATVWPKCTNKECAIEGPHLALEQWEQGIGHYSVEDYAIKRLIAWWNYKP